MILGPQDSTDGTMEHEGAANGLLRQRIFRAYFLSNMALIVVLLLTSIVFMTVTGARMQHVIRLHNGSVLEAAKSLVDERIQVAKNLALEIANDPGFDAFADARLPLTADDRYNAYLLSQRLASQIVAYPFVAHALYYFQSSDTIVTDEYRYSPGDFLSVRIAEGSISPSRWRSLLTGHESGRLEFLLLESILNPQEPLMAVFLPSPYTGTPYSIGTISILLDKQILGSHARDLLIDESAGFFIAGSNHQLLLAEGNEALGALLPELSFPSDRSKPVLFTTRFNGDRYLINATASTVESHWYVSITPRAVFYNENEFYTQLVFAFAVGSAAIGLILSFGLARTRSRPIQRIYGIIARENALSTDASQDEFEAIERSVQKLIGDERVSRTALRTYRPFLKSSLLIRLVRTGITPDSSDLHNEFNFSFDGEFFVVALLRVVPAERSTTQAEVEALCLTLAELIEERSGELPLEVLLGLDESTVGLLLNVSDASDARFAQIADAVRSIMSSASATAYIKTKSGIGTIRRGLEGVHESYKEAEKALRYSDFQGTDSAVAYAQIRDLKREFRFPTDLEQSLRASLHAGDSEKCLSTLNRIYETNFSNPSIYFELAQCLFFELMNASLKSLNELEIDAPTVFGDDYDPYLRLPSCETINDMKEELNFVYVKACEYVREREVERAQREADRLVRYIAEHLSDVTLDLTSAAEEFNLSTGYFSTHFKRIVGINFKDYLTERRVEEVQRLLRTTDLPLKTIAPMAGFSSLLTLHRNFKKVTGVTPNGFRTAASVNV